MAEFDSARRAALMQDLLHQVQGRSFDLLPFDTVKEKLRLKQIVDRGMQEVALEQIVGSVGREHAFNRAFLPREEALRGRWEEVRELAEGQSGFPPVELYYVNDVYFVVDGHHRISVARSLNAPSIEARVKEFKTLVPLTPETTLEDVILRSGLADFLETTGLQQAWPDEFRVTTPNGYERLADHISVHRYYRGLERGTCPPWDESVRSWRDTVYLPMIETIRKSGIMKSFQNFTETDLYLFTMDHLHYLRERYGHAAEKRERVVKHFALSQRKTRKRRKD
jgi:hypothetical protein